MIDRAGCHPRSLLHAALAASLTIGALTSGMTAGAPGADSTGANAGSSRIPTVTRLVKAFSELENQLDAAARAHDAEALDRLLAPDFEMRNAAAPAAPVPRADFIKRMQSTASAPSRIEQMAVHDLGATAITSFLVRYDASDAPAMFVVDVWSRADSEWRLLIRYIGPGGSRTGPSDALMPDSRDRIPKKY
jgi:Domain of unknown function (DUF4440)